MTAHGDSHSGGPATSDTNHPFCVIENGLRRIVEVIASSILVVEIGVLFVGVVARYAVGSPVTWSDELASILFIWLAMLGAAVAFQRNQHMKMTAFSEGTQGTTRKVLDVLGLAVPFAFLLTIVYPATKYALDEGIDELHCASRSTTTTRLRPQAARACASMTAVVDLPTPPLRLATARKYATSGPLQCG